MKAIQIEKYGNEKVLKMNTIPEPEFGDDEILVKVFSAGINPVDYKVREGHLSGFLKHKLPLILGWDFSGEVYKVGKNVTSFKIGDEVYSRPDIARDGAYAEYITVKASEVSLKPKTLTHQEASSVPLAALTAWQALFDEAKLVAGQSVLIHAGSGGVGSFAIQLAKHFGVTVYTTCSSKNISFVKSLGADYAIDYTQSDFSKEVENVAVVFDTIGGETQDKSWKTLKPGGMLISIVGEPNQELAKENQATGQFSFVQPNGARLSELAKLIDDKIIKVTIEASFPLDQVKEAHKRIESGRTKGKLVLDIV